MEVWTVISGIVVLLPATFSVDGLGTTYKGTIQVNTVTCSFAEYKNKDGRGPRGLRLSSCTSNKTLDCTYYGENPHNCKAYKPEQQKSIKKYYSALAESAMNNGDPCTLSSITENICDLSYLCYDGSCKENHPKEEL
ncbi:uncharacterized protein LOC124124664 [Haliotis rufescens]|uniref:uncharacterized protein LOC124124664 n=1 Tax=Haliotis rufescens TaxID=6454 RepID=UPI00201EC72E|nr:uncharacterized protein LOC124124664 [Haliotis rufescens]